MIIAADNDSAGIALGEELSRRLGRERCYRVRWPSRKEDTIVLGQDTDQESGGEKEFFLLRPCSQRNCFVHFRHIFQGGVVECFHLDFTMDGQDGLPKRKSRM